MKKYLALILALCMILALFAGCGPKEPAEEDVEEDVQENVPEEGEETAEGSVYYLNFKPEQDGAWQELAKAYTEETGVPVEVVTAAQGTYESSLTAEVAKSEPPTLFQVNGPVVRIIDFKSAPSRYSIV